MLLGTMAPTVLHTNQIGTYIIRSGTKISKGCLMYLALLCCVSRGHGMRIVVRCPSVRAFVVGVAIISETIGLTYFTCPVPYVQTFFFYFHDCFLFVNMEPNESKNFKTLLLRRVFKLPLNFRLIVHDKRIVSDFGNSEFKSFNDFFSFRFLLTWDPMGAKFQNTTSPPNCV